MNILVEQELEEGARHVVKTDSLACFRWTFVENLCSSVINCVLVACCWGDKLVGDMVKLLRLSFVFVMDIRWGRRRTPVAVADPGFESRGGGGGGAWNDKTQNLWSPALAPSRGSGGMKIGMRRYAFFTILGYNFRKIRERICKVICTYIYNFHKIFEVTGKIKKKIFNMKKIMQPTVDPATFFLDVYARMSSPLLQNPSVCPCGHWQAQQCIQAPLRHRAAVVWLDESQSRFFFSFSSSFFFFFCRHGGVPAPPPPATGLPLRCVWLYHQCLKASLVIVKLKEMFMQGGSCQEIFQSRILTSVFNIVRRWKCCVSCRLLACLQMKKKRLKLRLLSVVKTTWNWSSEYMTFFLPWQPVCWTGWWLKNITEIRLLVVHIFRSFKIFRSASHPMRFAQD